MKRSLWPREHGAYVQLLAPLATALAIAPTAPGILFATAACGAFLAHEALMVARGMRGVRRRDLDGARAGSRLRWAGAITIACAIAGVVLAPAEAIRMLPLVAIPATVAMIQASRRRLHTLGGEMIAAVALSSASVPVAAAGGIARADVLLLWAAWSVGFAATVVVVHGVLANHRKSSTKTAPRRTSFALLSIAAWVGMATLIAPLAAPAIPLVVASLVVEIAGPSARHVRAIGIALACASVLSGALAIYIV